jgi:hypothetical protein
MFQWQENDVVMDFHQKADLNRVQVGGMPKKSGNIPKRYIIRYGSTTDSSMSKRKKRRKDKQ